MREEWERASLDMSSKMFGFMPISMYTVPIIQQSSPCLTSKTRSTIVARSCPSFKLSIYLYRTPKALRRCSYRKVGPGLIRALSHSLLQLRQAQEVHVRILLFVLLCSAFREVEGV